MKEGRKMKRKTGKKEERQAVWMTKRKTSKKEDG